MLKIKSDVKIEKKKKATWFYGKFIPFLRHFINYLFQFYGQSKKIYSINEAYKL